jgi:hydrogenase large subunit
MHTTHSKVIIDPLTRIEGHLKIECVVEAGTVKEARTSGTLFRGFEIILKGRHPLDAPRLTQRVCGVCPTAHATASSMALDGALGIAAIPDNGRILRNLILASNFLQSHILHFYHLTALDYIDVAQVADYNGTDRALLSIKDYIARGELAPFVPRYEGDYRLDKSTTQRLVANYAKALEMRNKAHQLLTVFGGKMPHNVGTMPGGVIGDVAVDKVAGSLWRLNEIRDFIESAYLPDAIDVALHYKDNFTIGKGCGRYLSYGGFPQDGSNSTLFFKQGVIANGSRPGDVDTGKIREDVMHSWYEGPDSVDPYEETTKPSPKKKDAYSFLKSPRYDGHAVEVGPLARTLIMYKSGDKKVKELVDGAATTVGIEIKDLQSSLGRHVARVLEAKMVGDAMAEWILQLKPGEPLIAEFDIPETGKGQGLTEAPRGSVGHWVSLEGKNIKNYQLIVPTTWNASPRDRKGEPGPMEQALEGTTVKDENNPFELVRIVRSFDPCLACSVHVITAKGNDVGGYRVA